MQCTAKVKSAKAGTASATSASIGLLHLNDDCLLEIFMYLDLAAQVRLVLICPRLRGIFQSYALRRRSSLHQHELDSMCDMEMKLFLEMAGIFLEELHNVPYAMCKSSESFLLAVNEFCPNVRKVRFSKMKLPAECLTKLLCTMKYLSSLELQHCVLDSKVMRTVCSLKQLQCLKLEGMPHVTGHVCGLIALKELSLISCGIRDKYFIEMCKCLKRLKTLSLLWCDEITEAAICAMPLHCRELEVLRISCSYSIQYYALADLPKLTALELKAAVLNIFFTDQLLMALGKRKAEQLERLCIICAGLEFEGTRWPLAKLQQLRSFSCENIFYFDDDFVDEIAELQNLEMLNLRGCKAIYNDAVLTILENCEKLNQINVMDCGQLTEQLVYDVIELLEQRQQQQTDDDKPRLGETLLMLVADTGIKKSILKEPRYLAATSILRLSYSHLES